MSSMWKGNLRNTGTDVFIDTVLLVLIVCAYIPQISRLRKSTSMRGISPNYILFNVFFSNAQLSHTLFLVAYAWPNDSRPVLERISDGTLEGLAALGAILGLLQNFAWWLCSISVLMVFAAGAQAAKLHGRVVLITALIHATVVLLPAVAFTLPKPARHTFEKGILIALISMSNRVVAPCFAVLQFYAQFREMRARHWEPGVLSLLSIGLQVPIMAALGFRWLLRIGYPTWTRGPAPISLWYEWGFPVINYVVHAMGCAFILACYLLAARGIPAQGDLGGRAPLLG